jgi:signal peptidase I
MLLWRARITEWAAMHVHFFKTTATIIPVFMAGFDYIGCPQKVAGRSMRPTFNEEPLSSNWVWLNKWQMLVMPRRSCTRPA